MSQAASLQHSSSEPCCGIVRLPKGRILKLRSAAQRPLREYAAEPELARAVQEALARESSGQGGKALLHLVVLGHVDAGKSTLMGRLLHDLGCATVSGLSLFTGNITYCSNNTCACCWVIVGRPETDSSASCPASLFWQRTA